MVNAADRERIRAIIENAANPDGSIEVVYTNLEQAGFAVSLEVGQFPLTRYRPVWEHPSVSCDGDQFFTLFEHRDGRGCPESMEPYELHHWKFVWGFAEQVTTLCIDSFTQRELEKDAARVVSV